MIFCGFLYYLFTFIQLYPTVFAAHTRKKITPNRTIPNNKYDKTITTFDNIGRLLQVEYGRRASERGGSVACASLDFTCLNLSPKSQKDDMDIDGIKSQIRDGHRRGRVAVLAVTRKGSSYLSSNNSPDMRTCHKRYATSIPSRSEKVHRIDTHAILVTTGLLGDGYALANELRRIALVKRLNNGISLSHKHHEDEPLGDSIGVKVLARECASLQQQLTWTAGARPLGISATIVGIEPCESSVCSSLETPSVKLYNCDPGGEVEEYEFLATGEQSQVARRKILLLLNNLKRDIQQGQTQLMMLTKKQPMLHIDASKRLQETFLRQLIYGVANIALGNETTSHKKSTNNMVDIYVIERNVLCRGGIHILAAGLVERKKLMKVCSMLSS